MTQPESDRAIPMTSSRALTELIRSRRQLDAARRSLELATQIFERLDRVSGVPSAILKQVLAQLEEAEATLWEVAAQ